MNHFPTAIPQFLERVRSRPALEIRAAADAVWEGSKWANGPVADLLKLVAEGLHHEAAKKEGRSWSIWSVHAEQPGIRVEKGLTKDAAAQKLVGWTERHRTTGWSYEMRDEGDQAVTPPDFRRAAEADAAAVGARYEAEVSTLAAGYRMMWTRGREGR